MKLIEALKELKLITKKINGNIESIHKFSSLLSCEVSPFGTEEDQKQYVKKLIQSNLDLITYYLNLKKRIDFTNLKTIVEIDGRKYSISDLIQLKEAKGMNKSGNLCNYLIKTYDSLTTIYTEQRMSFFNKPDGSIKVISLYNESEKLNEKSKWMDLRDKIEGKLEVVNAQTDLLELE